LLLASSAENIDGRAYNLVGGVRPCARDYIADLGRVLGRPLKFHPQSATWLWLEDVGKWTIKRATGRNVPMPARRDFLSRGMTAQFDCSDAVRDLGWQPSADPEAFRQQALMVHAP
jgi:nucleoside-diphosphate-sugar epimerase